MARLTSVIEKKVKDIFASFAQVHEPSYFHYIGFRTLYFKLDLDLQTWNYEKIGLNLVNDQKFHETFGQNIALIGQKIALIGQKMPKLKLFRFFMIFLRFKSWIFLFFVNSDHAWILYLSPCHRIIFECEIIVWGWEPVRYTRLSAHRTPALWFWHCWFAGRLQDIVGHYGKVSSGISPLCTPLSMPFKMCSLFQYHWTSTFCSKCLGLFF